MSETQAQATVTPGRQIFETTFITKSELSDDLLKTLRERLVGVVKQYNGDVVKTEDWGKRKLAYPIQKESRGHYTYLEYTGDHGIVPELERQLRMNESVLRFLSVRQEKESAYDAERILRRRLAAAKKAAEEGAASPVARGPGVLNTEGDRN